MKFSLFAKGLSINSNTKKKIILLTVCSMLFIPILSGCTQEKVKDVVDKVRQVSVFTVNEEAYRESLVYNGFVKANQILPLKFQRDGKVENVYVEAGKKVKAGDLLMKLVKVNESDVTGNIYAPIDGIISQVLVDEGVLTSKDYPAVIIQSIEERITIGVTSEDYKKIVNYGEPSVIVTINGVDQTAKFKSVSMIPDAATMTYAVDVDLDPIKQFLVGDLAQVKLELTRINGIWLPISYIQNDGEDYVFIVNADNRVERRNLKLNELNNAFVRVVGLNDKDRVITVGNSFVSEGQLVNAREDVHE